MLMVEKTNLDQRPLKDLIKHCELLITALLPTAGLEYVAAQVPSYMAGPSNRRFQGPNGLANLEADQAGLLEDLPLRREEWHGARMTSIVSVSSQGEAERVYVGVMMRPYENEPIMRWLFSVKVWGIDSAWQIARLLQNEMDHLMHGETTLLPSMYQHLLEDTGSKGYVPLNLTGIVSLEIQDVGDSTTARVRKEDAAVIADRTWTCASRNHQALAWLGDWLALLSRQQARDGCRYTLALAPTVVDDLIGQGTYAWRRYGAVDLPQAAKLAGQHWQTTLELSSAQKACV